MIRLVLPADAVPDIRQEAIRLQFRESGIFTLEHVLRDMRGMWELFQSLT